MVTQFEGRMVQDCLYWAVESGTFFTVWCLIT